MPPRAIPTWEMVWCGAPQSVGLSGGSDGEESACNAQSTFLAAPQMVLVMSSKHCEP